MLITLGFSMIAVFMYLILTKRLTPMVALILVPLTFAALAARFESAVTSPRRPRKTEQVEVL